MYGVITGVAAKGGGGGTRGPCRPLLIGEQKRVRDWSKPLHITNPTATLQLHLMCNKCYFIHEFSKISVPSLPSALPPPPPPPPPPLKNPGYATGCDETWLHVEYDTVNPNRSCRSQFCDKSIKTWAWGKQDKKEHVIVPETVSVSIVSR